MMGCSLNTMLYRIKTLLLRAGLLEVVREEPRKGRAVKIYRSVHDAYFIPFQRDTLRDAGGAVRGSS